MILKVQLEQVLSKQLKMIISNLSPSDLAINSKTQSEISRLVDLFETLSIYQKANLVEILHNQVTNEYSILKIKCPHCESSKSGVIRFIAHIFTFHSSHSSNHCFVYHIEEEKLILTINSAPAGASVIISNEQLVQCQHDLNETLNLVYLFESFYVRLINSGITFKQMDLQMFKLEEQVQRMLTTKRFFHGPSRNFEPILSVKEFLDHSDDEQSCLFEIQNEQNSLLNETWELPQDKEYFWTLWNQTVMEFSRKHHFVIIHYKDLKLILQDVLDQMGENKIKYHSVIIEHLTALLLYQCISQREYVKLLQIV